MYAQRGRGSHQMLTPYIKLKPFPYAKSVPWGCEGLLDVDGPSQGWGGGGRGGWGGRGDEVRKRWIWQICF